MQSKRSNMNEIPPQKTYVSAVVSVTASRPQHAPQGPPFFGGYPPRVPPPSNYNEALHPQHFVGYPQPRQPYSAPERDEREPRYDRNTLPQPPTPTIGYQRTRSSSQEYYHHRTNSFPAGGPPPPPPPPPLPPPLESRFDLCDRKGSVPVNIISQGDCYSSQAEHYSSRPYGVPYPQPRSRSWGNGESLKCYTESYNASSSGPYTSAQRPDRKEQEKLSSKDDGGIANFRIIGNSASPVASQKPFIYTLSVPPTPVSNKVVKSSPNSTSCFVGDGISYKAPVSIESRNGALSPSEIESNRRDDVSNMGCTCKKSKCLKLYCVCFGASVMCGINCRCLICHNTPSHEQSRKDAIRCILARNPSAFDTKFKKAADARAITTNKSLTHKLGCKCRKSFCTKKYCECYNAGVKCSGSCRCVSCKNMPPGGFTSSSDEKEAIALLPRSFVADIVQAKMEGNKAPNSENKMMDAAQHLAFLKHASPVRNKIRFGSDSTNENSSLPYLESSSPGTTTSSPDVDFSKRRNGLETGGVNTLLMAAYAMTELSEHSAPSTPEREKSEPPFRSPKRKSLDEPSKGFVDDQFADAEDIEDVRGERDGKSLRTPNNGRQIKRTRMGSIDRTKLHKKTGVIVTMNQTNEILLKPNYNNNGSLIEETDVRSEGRNVFRDIKITSPKGQKKKTVLALTPVSARCIDFQHLGIEKNFDEKKDSYDYTEK
mmetsp:Transcript_42664/g.48481  ORF Transcript_42664/g.48481 Transcript_42664/m.48481 type:complete len:712 (-) Transcript_42664:8-2143(-)